METKYHPKSIWYIFPMVAVSVDTEYLSHKYLSLGWLCFSVYFYFGA